MLAKNKVMRKAELESFLSNAKYAGRRVVGTNGCFDILHAGHVTCLEWARAQGGLLVVGLNGDDSVRKLKGHGRPVNTEADRARILASMECVDAVFVFQGDTAGEFIEILKPDIYVKGGDYNFATINGSETSLLANCRAKLLFSPKVDGRSTTDMLSKLTMPPAAKQSMVVSEDKPNTERLPLCHNLEIGDNMPNPKLPPLGGWPRRRIFVEIEVPADFPDRLDMQWVVEREIRADRWQWGWKKTKQPNDTETPTS